MQASTFDPVGQGYTQMAHKEGYIAMSGPYYWKREGDTTIYGFQSDERHGNPNGVLHGAALLTFVDTFIGHAVVSATARKCATIGINAQFVAGTPAGCWVTGHARLRKVTRSLAFVDAETVGNDMLLLTASAIFRVFETSQSQ